MKEYISGGSVHVVLAIYSTVQRTAIIDWRGGGRGGGVREDGMRKRRQQRSGQGEDRTEEWLWKAVCEVPPLTESRSHRAGGGRGVAALSLEVVCNATTTSTTTSCWCFPLETTS